MLQLLYNIADVIVVGKFENPAAVASVTATSSLITLMVNLFIGLSVGHERAGGAVSPARASTARCRIRWHTSVALSLVMGVLVGAFGLIMSAHLLVWMGTPGGRGT